MRTPAVMAAASLALLSCAEPSPEVMVAVRLYDEPVLCDATAGECRAPDGSAVAFEDHRVLGVRSRAASQYGESGLYLHFQMPRPSGGVAVVELDVPAAAGASWSSLAPRAIYREYRGDRRVFDGATAWGVVEVPMDASCPCQDGRLELIFRGKGPDGIAGTVDDGYRRLSMGRFGGAGECRMARVKEVRKEAGLLVDGLYGCPSASNSGGSNTGGGEDVYDEDLYYTGCAPPPDEAWDEGGCEGDTSDDAWEEGGCEGDDSGGGWDSGGGDDWEGEGCGGDTSGGGDSMDMGGCEGDSSADALSCEGDAHAAVGRSRARRGRSSGAAGFLLPVSLALLITWRRRRRILR